MESSIVVSTPIPAPTTPGAYRFLRAVIRLWFTLTLRKIRVLHEARLEAQEPALLVVSHPESFLDALILVAGLERPVRCLILAGLVKGPIQLLLARGLGMITFLPENRQPALETCRALLWQKAALVTFVEPDPGQPVGGGGLAMTAASIAAQAESAPAGGLGLALLTVHLFVPVGRTRTRESLIDIDEPELARDCLAHDSETENDRVRELARYLESKCQENSFRLQPMALGDFLVDLEQVFREDLQENLRLHPAPKQKLEGFELSRFVVQWAEQMNYLHPGLLVSLRESLAVWREASRRGALHRLEVEGAGGWLRTPLGRAVVLLETAAGAGVAVYGLANHLLAAAVLYGTGLMKKSSDADKTKTWVWRVVIVVGSYVAQVFLVAHFWGRRGAGYYLPTLPLSGLYLWRYAGLLRRQARIAIRALNLSWEPAATTRFRKDFLHEINRALARHAEILGVPH